MKKIIITLALPLFLLSSFAQVTVRDLLCENLSEPIGIDAVNPRFSWQLAADKRNVMQTAFEINVYEGKKIVWNSGKVNSDRSVQITYAGKALESEKKYTWQVRVWDNDEKVSAWSETNTFRMALLAESDWTAKWIMPGYEEDALRASPLFRKLFSTQKKIITATAYITAHGLYEAQINGQKIGDAYLTPGWTSYKKRLQYQVYDVTDLVKKGSNAIAVTLGSGWYRGIIGFSNNVNVYGKDIALLFQMRVTYSDGSTELIVSDDTWKSSTGSIVYSEIYNGETIDARKEKKGWALPGYNDADWAAVKTADFSKAVLVATQNESVKKHETFKAVKIITTAKGEKVIDFGQNLVGWVKLKVKGVAGNTITLSHAEVLDKQGNFYTDNLRKAKAQDVYILKGGEEEMFEPHFTWQGFRYVNSL